MLSKIVAIGVLLLVMGHFYNSPYWGDGALKARAEQARSWPTTEGTVIYASTTPAEREEGFFVRVGLIPDVLYEYAVDHRVYRGQTAWLRSDIPYSERDTRHARRRNGKLLAHYLAENYPPGQRVTVHYDPKNPHDALLELDSPSHFAWSYYMTVGFFLGALIASLGVSVALLFEFLGDGRSNTERGAF